MTLGEKQRKFTMMLARLLIYADSLGYGVTLGRGAVSQEANQADGGIDESCHLYRLAQDLNLFNSDGAYLTATKDHEPLGAYWVAMGGSWGGDFDDGNHYSLEHNGIK